MDGTREPHFNGDRPADEAPLCCTECGDELTAAELRANDDDEAALLGVRFCRECAFHFAAGSLDPVYKAFCEKMAAEHANEPPVPCCEGPCAHEVEDLDGPLPALAELPAEEVRRLRALDHHAWMVDEDVPGFDFDQDPDGDFLRPEGGA